MPLSPEEKAWLDELKKRDEGGPGPDQEPSQDYAPPVQPEQPEAGSSSSEASLLNEFGDASTARTLVVDDEGNRTVVFGHLVVEGGTVKFKEFETQEDNDNG